MEPIAENTASRESLFAEIRDLMLSSLFLHHVSKESITDKTLFFDEGLELDSIDILELVVAIENKLGVTIDDKVGREVFKDFGTLIDYVYANKPK